MYVCDISICLLNLEATVTIEVMPIDILFDFNCQTQFKVFPTLYSAPLWTKVQGTVNIYTNS